MGKWEILFEFSTITSLFGFLQAFFQEVKLLIFFLLPKQCFGMLWSCFVAHGKANMFSERFLCLYKFAEELFSFDLCNSK